MGAGVLAGALVPGLGGRLVMRILGTIGVGDAMSPDNQDFAILHPTWLAVTLIVVLALLFGVTFTALAARFAAGMRCAAGCSDLPGHVSVASQDG